MKLEWSAAALADLDRFATFLQRRHPHLASIIAAEILAKAEIILGQLSASAWFGITRHLTSALSKTSRR